MQIQYYFSNKRVVYFKQQQQIKQFAKLLFYIHAGVNLFYGMAPWFRFFLKIPTKIFLISYISIKQCGPSLTKWNFFIIKKMI